MKTIIAGGRNCTDEKVLLRALENIDWEITEILCGLANGADLLGKRYGDRLGIPVRLYPAQWSVQGYSAGPIRNKEMAIDSEALIALWDGVTNGTKNMIQIARKYRLKIHVEIFEVELDKNINRDKVRGL